MPWVAINGMTGLDYAHDGFIPRMSTEIAILGLKKISDASDSADGRESSSSMNTVNDSKVLRAAMCVAWFHV
jgi:hypothetical protein